MLEIAEAMDAPKTTIPLMSAAGCVSGEFVYLYPPGIPILAPGERVTEEILETLRICQARNMQIEGMKDYSGQSLESVIYCNHNDARVKRLKRCACIGVVLWLNDQPQHHHNEILE